MNNKCTNSSMLRFLVCGSVDDGKSTLIGRFLYDSKKLYDDHILEVKTYSKNRKCDLSLSLVTDGLKEEREKGITIDVSYKYCNTKDRKFIIVDSPGHEEFTRNMFTGASNCDLAVMMVDAKLGILTQTKRHTFLCDMLGIKKIILAVNKMDLIDWDSNIFKEICKKYKDITEHLNFEEIICIPISALNGDNVVYPKKTFWYSGNTLLEHLEKVEITNVENLSVRIPVQYIIKENGNEHVAGTMLSGSVSPGDKLLLIPKNKELTVSSIFLGDKKINKLEPNQSATFDFEKQGEINRGDMIVSPDYLPNIKTTLSGLTVWFDNYRHINERNLLLKSNNKITEILSVEVINKIDINKMHENENYDDAVIQNDINRVIINVKEPVVFDKYTQNKYTGSFIIIDKLNKNTVAAGIIS